MAPPPSNFPQDPSQLINALTNAMARPNITQAEKQDLANQRTNILNNLKQTNKKYPAKRKNVPMKGIVGNSQPNVTTFVSNSWSHT